MNKKKIAYVNSKKDMSLMSSSGNTSSLFKLTVIPVQLNLPFCYKIFSGLDNPLEKIRKDKSHTDWSHSIYCQLTSELSFSYLPNRWDEDSVASLYRLSVKNEALNVLLVEGEGLKRSDISSLDKAIEIKRLLHDIDGFNDQDDETKLMTYLGQKQLIFCGIDADTYEVSIPKCLLTEEFFLFEKVVEFQRYNNMPMTKSFRLLETDDWSSLPKDISDSDLNQTVGGVYSFQSSWLNAGLNR